MEYSPPPFFKQGPSARARLIFFSVLAVTLLVVDARFSALTVIRQGVGTVLYPLQRAVLMPGVWVTDVERYFSSMNDARDATGRLERDKLVLASAAMGAQQLAAENAELRKLLGVRERTAVKSVAAEILYDARDPFARKIVIDRGVTHDIAAGQPVIDETGVIGQVTRVFPFSSEVTLLTDKNQAIPVQIVRSGLRAVAYGSAGNGQLDLRFMASNADVQEGDVLVTSGLDGIYPAGLPVARVVRIERNAAYAFARILCAPLGGIDRNRHVLVLSGTAPAPAVPVEEPAVRPRKGKS